MALIMGLRFMADPKLRVKQSGMGGSGYRLPFLVDEAGKATVVPGVTTVTGFSYKPGVVQWAVDNTAAYAVANIDSLLSRTEEQGYGMLRWYHKRKPEFDNLLDDELRSHHIGVLDDAASLGTWIHDYIEASVNGDFEPTPLNEKHVEMATAWEDFKAQHDIVPLATELTVFNRDEGYAGTLDGIWVIDGVPTLLDVKSSRSTWPEHYEQLAALGACYESAIEVPEETEGAFLHETKQWGKTWWVIGDTPGFSQYKVLHVRPADYDNEGNYMEPYCRLEDAKHIDLHYESFLGSLAKKKTELKIKQREKEEVF